MKSTRLSCLLPLISFLVLLGALQWCPTVDLLAYQRAQIMQGELWRLVTAHLIHTNGYHLALNATGALLIGLLYPRQLKPMQFVTDMGALCIVTSLWVLCLFPSISWFVGLSGVLHGWLLLQAMRQWPQAHRYTNTLLIIAIVAKVGYESIWGGNPATAKLIEADVLTEGHLAGVLAGLLIWLAQHAIRTLRVRA